MARIAKILVVDDEYDKRKVIAQLVAGSADIKFVDSSMEALQELRKEQFDLLIIDLQIPEAVGDDVDPEGGRKLLEYMDEDDSLLRPIHVLGLTSYKDSYLECKQSFEQRGWLLQFGVEDEELLANRITAQLRHAVDPPAEYDVAVITALERPELTAILDWPCDWVPLKEAKDSNVFYSTILKTDAGQDVSIILTSCQHMGVAYSAAVTMKVCCRYKPKRLFMAGIAAGVPGRVEIGDVLVADPIWDWGNGKQTIRAGKPVFLSAPRQIPLGAGVRARLQKLARQSEAFTSIWEGAQNVRKPDKEPSLHVGPVATGSVVLEDPSVVEMIQSQHRETIGIEMEGYGVAVAASLCGSNAPVAIVVKAVCDFADPSKNNEWQEYAAYTSAQVVKLLITSDVV